MAEQIFMGNGDHSAARCYELHRKLERAFNVLGGIQQPPHGNVFPGEFTEGMHEVERIAREIYETLTGNEIEDA